MIAAADSITTDIPSALEFVAAVFEPGDVAEFRCLRGEDARKFWAHGDEVGPLMEDLQRLNREGWNVYVGVNPRRDFNLSGNANVTLARCMFADFDHGTTVDEALQRAQAAGLPHPSIVIGSGHGVHLYWLLAEPIEDVAAWTKYMDGLAALLGSDPSVTNAERIMRVCGFHNWKNPPAPCTLHELDGGRFEWAEILPLIPLPVSTASVNGNGEHRAPPVGDEIRAGGRNATLTSLAGSMRRRGMNGTSIEAALLAENAAKCRPMLDEDEVRSIAASVSKYPAAQAAEQEHQDTEPLVTVAAGKLLADFPELLPPLVDGFLRVKETCNVIAAAKFGKTHTILDLTMSVITGRAWLGRFRIVNPGPVLYIDAELHQNTMARRVAAICTARGILSTELEGKLDVLSLRGRLRNIYQLRRWLEENAVGKYRMIVFDALYRLIPEGIEENSNSDMTRVFNVIDQIAEVTGSAVLIVHHSSKGVQASKAVVDVGSGASAMARATDSHLIFRQHEEDGCAVMELAARSWPPLVPVALRWTYPTWAVDEKLDPALLRAENRRKRKEELPVDTTPTPTVWTPEKFVEAFIVTDPRTEAMILSGAVISDLSERKAKRLLSAAIDLGIIHRWTYSDRKKPHRFATAEQPVALTNDGGAS